MYAEEHCEYCGTPYSDDRDENGLPFCECDAAEVYRLRAAIAEKDAEIARLNYELSAAYVVARLLVNKLRG